MKKCCSHQLLRVLGSVVLFCAGALYARTLDLNGNGMSDIWELIYGASGLSPTGDADGDGVPNGLEAIAGTDPFDAKSVPRISFMGCSSNNFVVGMPCALGKAYQLESAQSLASGSWVIVTNLVARSGTNITLSVPLGMSPKFFRIAVSDVDSDWDGLNDWEEYQLGLDPFNPTSNGQLDGNGQPMTDFDYVVSRLASQNVVTISASDPVANQPDPGQAPINIGAITVGRGGFPLNSVTVNLGLATPGPGVAVEGTDHAVLPRSITLPAGTSSLSIPVTPLADTNLMTPVTATMKVLSGTGYTVGTPNSASVVVYPSGTPSGTGLVGQYFTNSSATYSNSANFNPANLQLTKLDPTVDFVWGTTTNPIPNSGYYSVRWTGQVQPEFSETYYFDVNSDDGVKLWVNDQLVVNNWTAHSASDSIGTISLQAGVRYDLRLEYFQGGGAATVHLYWYSPSQPKQIIPSTRLYPSSSGPSSVTSPMTAVAFLGQPFSYTVTGANTPFLFKAFGLPPGLLLNTTNGAIRGIPNVAGDFQVTLTTSNAVGLGASVLDIQVIDTGSSVSREVWTNVPGTNVADIPLSVPATLTNTLGSLEGITNYGDNYAERVRGYITVPASGDYYFWLAAKDSAELWISNDAEPVNKVRRAFVLPAGTGPRMWNIQTNQRSPWLSLIAGQRYYVEVLHKAGGGTNDNWSVGWLQDSTGTNTAPSGIVPGYVLSRYFPLPLSLEPGTLYSANMLPQANVQSSAVGSATLRLSPDGSRAILKFSYSGLSSPLTGEHIHADPYLSNPSQIIFDIDAAVPQVDGSYVWNIAPIGTLSAADIVEVIQEGKAYINIHTVNNPSGEINGHFTAAVGSQTFSPPPPAPSWTDDHSSSNAAARFLIQATFGPTAPDIAAVQSLGYAGWINNQISLPASHHLTNVLANTSADPSKPYPGNLTFNTWWQQSVTAPDQLRQRMAFALSEIMVVSENGVLQDNARALSSYYDILLDNAFGNFRSLLKAVTLSPAMGLYLDMRGNDKGSLTLGTHPNENYAREIMQLFSIGLNRMWPDGTLVLNSAGALVPTYDQNVIMGLASVFTGWNYYQTNQPNGRLPTSFYPPANYTNPMVLVPTHHDLGTKQLLDNSVSPAAQGSQADSTSTNYDIYCSQDLESALDTIFYNQNVGPFICRQLIQRFVTSNPSRDYLYRVVQVFNNNGVGVRGDLSAVLKAILLDYEARSPSVVLQPTYGKQREPLLRVTATARAFPGPPSLTGNYTQSGNQTIAVTTSAPHRLNNQDTVLLTWTATSSLPPPAQGYSITVTGANSFSVNAPGLLVGKYSQANNSNIVSIANHGVGVGFSVYLAFTSGTATNGVYQVIAVADTTHFTVATSNPTTVAGDCLLHKWTGGGFTQAGTNVTVSTSLAHGLVAGNNVYINFAAAGSPPTGQYQVLTVPDPTHFTIVVSSSANQNQNNMNIYPLIPPPLSRSGTVTTRWNTWNMNATDGGSSSSLAQTPLSAPTVFNFFYPDYKFPGPLAAAGLTTPEFQLTSDSSVAAQMNFLEGGILNNSGNTNGLSSFVGGNGALVIDLGPWMTSQYTSDSGIPVLVDALNTLLAGGQLSLDAKSKIVAYVANTNNFPLGTPPTTTQMRDRVQAVVHLLVTSPDFTIQK